MAKINLYHGTMGSGKTLDLIRTVYNYREKGMRAYVYKPSIDTRDGVDDCIIRTRVGMELDAAWLSSDSVYWQLLEDNMNNKADVIIVDEAQFLSESQVNDFQDFSITNNIPIIFYGLKVDFTGHLFEGTKRIIEIADVITEVKGICHCGSIARQNARVVDGKIQKEGEVVVVGGNELYMPLCNKCFFEGRVK